MIKPGKINNIVLFAPHQDDEVLSAFLFLNHQKLQGNKVLVIFATNGDYKGREVATIRARESMKALSLIGLTEEDVFFMGYGDTGMHPAHSFLFKLYHSEWDTVLTTPYSDRTYHPLGEQTVHRLFYGNDTLYKKESFHQDIEMIMRFFKPDVLLIPSCRDFHGGHQVLGKWIMEVLIGAQSIIPVYSYLVHAGDDLSWPNRKEDIFLRPENLSSKVWEKRIIFSFPSNLVEMKQKAIRLFISQQPEAQNGYLSGFAKQEEIFWIENDVGLSYH
jgi:LmbE family N-acetylglucosaminyl deacetylase